MNSSDLQNNDYISLKDYCVTNKFDYKSYYNSLKENDIGFAKAFGDVFVLKSLLNQHTQRIFLQNEQNMKNRRERARIRSERKIKDLNRFNLLKQEFLSLPDAEKQLLSDRFTLLFEPNKDFDSDSNSDSNKETIKNVKNKENKEN